MNEAFDATLTLSQRHLARRLESFGDVVFGFTISQLVLQFPLPVAPTDLMAHRTNYVVYFVTFTIIALLWLAYHRMLSIAYAPRPVDIALTFAFLACTGLAPYAMYAYLHFMTTPEGARYGLGAYLIVGIGTFATSLGVQVRSYRRGAPFMDDAERLKTYRRVLATAAVVVVFALVLVSDIALGVQIAVFGFFLMPLASVLIRRIKQAPPAVPAVTAVASERFTPTIW